MLEAMHPAAVGSAMAFIIYDDRDMRSLILLLLAIVGLLTVVKIMVYIYREELEFRQFSREFRRTYYGDELTLMLQRDEATEKTDTPEKRA